MIRLCLALLLATALTGCRQNDAPPDDAKILVAATVAPHAWLVQQIGGEHVEVLTLVQAGESAETYQPSDAQVSRVARSKAFFCTGMPLETSSGFVALRSSGLLRVVDLRQGIALRQMPVHHHEEDGHGHAGHGHDEHGHDEREGSDPHIWLSPRLLKIQAQTVADTLSEIDPDHRTAYQNNLAALEEKLDETAREIDRLLAPHRGRAFLVFHPAWGYFAAEPQLRQLAIESEGKEPSDEEMTALQKLAREEKIRVVFRHPQSGQRTAEAIAQGIGGRVEVIDDLPDDLLPSLLKTARLLARSFE